MAIWQYTFHVLPKKSVEVLSSDYHFTKSEDGFDDERYWNLDSYNKVFFHFVEEILPKKKSWSDEIDWYGDQESNCFEVLFDRKGNVLSVSFRVDFRSNYENVLRQIIEFFSLKGLVLLDEALNIVPHNYEQAQNVIEASPQGKIYHELSKKDKS